MREEKNISSPEVVSVDLESSVMINVDLEAVMEHGQLCPLAKATEILAERWTFLVIQELLSGHHQGSAAARDAVKKEALLRVGIGYHEVVAGHITPSVLRRLIERLVDRPRSCGQLLSAHPFPCH